MEKPSAIIQARLGSARLPNKILANVGNKPMLVRVVDELKKCKNLKDIIIATPDNLPLSVLMDNVKVYIGEEQDVLMRFIRAAEQFGVKDIVRICADSPFIQHWVIDYAIDIFNEKRPDYLVSYCLPKGQNIEIVTLDTLKKIYNRTDQFDKEHVTYYLEHNYEEFNIEVLKLNLSVDTEEDLERVNKISEYYDRL